MIGGYRRQALFPEPGSAPVPAIQDEHRGAPWQSFEDRAVTDPFSFAGNPVHSQSLVQVPVLGNLRADSRPRQIILGSPLGIVNVPNIRPVPEDNPRLIQDEQQAVLNKLKKEIYNPIPKNLLRRLSLYYRDEAISLYNQMQKLKEEDTMRCAVCLEDFEPKERVMLTPCNHMFHEECIVPWVKGHARCPVCRFSLSEKKH